MEYSNEYNGFNDWKILCHFDYLKKLADNEFNAPIAVDTDPSNVCNQNCIYCNSYAYRKKTKQSMLSKEHLIKLAHFYKAWGVKSTCIAGGGEPLTNSGTKKFIQALAKSNIEIGLISNGVLLDIEYAELLSTHAKFCGISIDGSNSTIYKKMRGADHLNTVIKNTEQLNNERNKKNSLLDVNYKFLIHPLNCSDIYNTAKLAKEVGCCGIHIRPAALENVEGIKHYDFSEKDISTANEQIHKCFELESSTFKIYAVLHKFNSNLGKVIKFNKCRITPMTGVFGADGYFHLCFNMRGRKNFQLGQHYPSPDKISELWGSSKHKALLEKINPTDCIRCSFTRYNEVIEHCILKDDLFVNFI